MPRALALAFTAVAFGFFAPSIHALTLSCTQPIAIAPVPVGDVRLATWLATLISKEIPRIEKLDCNPILPYSETTASFDQIGATTAFPLTAKQVKAKQIAHIQSKLGVDLVLFANPLGQNGVLKVGLYVIEQETFKKIKNFNILVDMSERPQHQSAPLPRYLSGIAGNAVMTGFSSTAISLVNKDAEYRHTITKSHGLLPPIVSSMSVTRVEHPLGFGLFDISGSLFPGLFLFAINQDTTLSAPKNAAYPETTVIHLESYGACGNLNGQGSLFSPIGTTYMSLGWGPCAMQLRREGRKATSYLSAATRALLGHRVFVTENLFISIEFDLLFFSQKIYEYKKFEASSIERYSLNFGWYITDSDNLFLKSWNALFGWL